MAKAHAWCSALATSGRSYSLMRSRNQPWRRWWESVGCCCDGVAMVDGKLDIGSSGQPAPENLLRITNHHHQSRTYTRCLLTLIELRVVVAIIATWPRFV